MIRHEYVKTYFAKFVFLQFSVLSLLLYVNPEDYENLIKKILGAILWFKIVNLF